jgi:hypothetical protein
MLVTVLNEEDRALLDGMYDGLGQGERDRLLQGAVRILPARGWRRPELAGEDPEQMMHELLLQRSFGPEQLRKYRARVKVQEDRGGQGRIQRNKSQRNRRGVPAQDRTSVSRISRTCLIRSSLPPHGGHGVSRGGLSYLRRYL